MRVTARWKAGRLPGLVGLLAALFVFCPVLGQTREKGPWWPHPIWGAEDQSGGSNWITPSKIVEAVRLVREGRTYELGHLYERDMPVYGERTYAMFIPEPDEKVGKNQLVWNDEFLCAEIGQVGTQFDGPGHIGTRMTMADGTVKSVFYNGFTQEDDFGNPYGLRQLGVENVKPILTRGILIDVAGYKGLDRLPNSYEVTPADAEGALRKQGIDPASIRDGDALIFRYGWSQLWGQPDAYNTNPPGIGLATAAWVVSNNASMVGSDSWTTEVVPNPNPDLMYPVHQELINKAGVWNLENMDLEDLARDGVYEFLFVLTPIRFKGATGSPARPVAIR